MGLPSGARGDRSCEHKHCAGWSASHWPLSSLIFAVPLLRPASGASPLKGPRDSTPSAPGGARRGRGDVPAGARTLSRCDSSRGAGQRVRQLLADCLYRHDWLLLRVWHWTRVDGRQPRGPHCQAAAVGVRVRPGTTAQTGAPDWKHGRAILQPGQGRGAHGGYHAPL
eukprot:ctg_2043.g413